MLQPLCGDVKLCGQPQTDRIRSTIRPRGLGSCSTTAPPLRLRMTSADILCARSMEVGWEDGTGIRQTWSSWSDELENGWYEAEKLLPSSATDISVHFKVHGLGGPWDVCRVDRRRKCEWVADGNGRHQSEVIWLRASDAHLNDEVDAIFELAGHFNGCYIRRAWNCVDVSSDRYPWEHWSDALSRPRVQPPCSTLEAADGAAPLAVGLGNPRVYLICTTKRMCAAARELVEIHRQTLRGLRQLDAKFTGQWWGVNMGTSASAGLGIASAVLLFVAPPVGVGLGVGSAVTGGLAFAGDVATDRELLADFRSQLSRDTRDAFAVAELLREWLLARQALVAYSACGEPPCASSSDSCTGVQGISVSGVSQRQLSVSSSFSMAEDVACWGAAHSSSSNALGTALDTGLTAGAVAEGAAATGTRVAQQLGQSVAAAASQVLGIAGALISTGYAIRGWSSTKAGQTAVRQKSADLTKRLLQLQHLLASVDRLECPICADGITLAESVRRCMHSFHCFHDRCLHRYASHCPSCESPLEMEAQMMVDSVDQPHYWQHQRRKSRTSSSTRSSEALATAHRRLVPRQRTLSVSSSSPHGDVDARPRGCVFGQLQSGCL
eukprot:gb/GFBE01074877.1/.p1 GENE.gb/GFBE01074877.1/~~gb/GFBE01074877.1/.p1  ORF type:complete len:609 (+),score=99.32 gb/GFBE01074877.1/:1-1827(+)